MDLRQLRYFVAVADELHFGRAAGRLRISTPTLSQQIAALERDLGHRLVDRDSHRVALTAAGSALLPDARALLAHAERARQNVGIAATGKAQLDLRVATGLEMVLGDLLEQVSQAVTVNFTSTSSTDAEVAVVSGRADGAFVWPNAHGPRVRTHTVHVTEAYLAVPRRHALADQERVLVEQLLDEDIALFPQHLSPGVWDLFHRHLVPDPAAHRGRILDLPTKLAPMSAMLGAVAEGRAVAPFVPQVASRLMALEEQGVRMVPLEPPLRMPLKFIWSEPVRPALRPLLRLVADLDGPAVGDAARTTAPA